MSLLSAANVRGTAAADYRHFTAKIDEFKLEQKEARKKEKKQGFGQLIGSGVGTFVGLKALSTMFPGLGAASAAIQLMAKMGAAAAGAGVGSKVGQEIAVGGKKGNVGIGKFYQEQGRQANRSRQESINATAISDAATAAKGVFAFSKFSDFAANLDTANTAANPVGALQSAAGSGQAPINYGEVFKGRL